MLASECRFSLLDVAVPSAARHSAFCVVLFSTISFSFSYLGESV